MKRVAAFLAFCLGSPIAYAALVTNPDDARIWQGATVGTFAQLFYGADTAATRQQVVSNQLLDDGIFNSTGYLPGTLIHSVGQYSTQGGGVSTDLTGTGGFDYILDPNDPNPSLTRFDAANTIDNTWMQTSGVLGETVWDLGFQATKAAVFNTIDHGPLPAEAIESTVIFRTITRTPRAGYKPKRSGCGWKGSSPTSVFNGMGSCMPWVPLAVGRSAMPQSFGAARARSRRTATMS